MNVEPLSLEEEVRYFRTITAAMAAARERGDITEKLNLIDDLVLLAEHTPYPEVHNLVYEKLSQADVPLAAAKFDAPLYYQ